MVNLAREIMDLVIAFCVVIVIMASAYFIPESWGPYAAAAPMILFTYFIIKFIRWRMTDVPAQKEGV